MRMICSSRFLYFGQYDSHALKKKTLDLTAAYLESLVLKNTLDGSILVGRRELCLEDNTERSISHNFTLCIL